MSLVRMRSLSVCLLAAALVGWGVAARAQETLPNLLSSAPDDRASDRISRNALASGFERRETDQPDASAFRLMAENSNPSLLSPDSDAATSAIGKETITTEGLSQRVSELERELKAIKSAKADAKKDEAKSDAKAADGWQDMSNDKWTVKLGGHVQLDYVNWVNPDSAISGPNLVTNGTADFFEFRRLRLVADGTGYGMFDFRLQMTLEPETVGETAGVTSPDVKDAYFSMNEIPYLGRFRIGNFFVPFSLEQVTNDTNNIFMERSIPTQGIFAADREVGIAFYNCSDDQNVTWTYGAFFDSVSEGLKDQFNAQDGYRLVGRATWLPYYDEPTNGRYLVFLGAGILHTDDQNNSVRLRARPQIHEGQRLIDSGSMPARSFTTGSLEFTTVWGPFTLQSEAFLSRIDRTTADDATVHGAYAHASYFLTGENRIFERFGQHGPQFSRNVPHTNFFLVPGGWGSGALEMKARWSYLNLDEVNRVSGGTRFGGRYNDLTVGFNWYWSDRTRVMFDWIHPVTSSQTTFGETTSDLLAMRFDFNW